MIAVISRDGAIHCSEEQIPSHERSVRLRRLLPYVCPVSSWGGMGEGDVEGLAASTPSSTCRRALGGEEDHSRSTYVYVEGRKVDTFSC